ncbi:MAG: thioredoxin domain-containing protein [Epsilonproteobacteria bacterium]|nr:MAG: thioredoxin domain-containing protein [Campylobacterota bacterium]
MSNRLKNEHSPYLQQHADNPVDWYPWGEEAFEKAKRENKSIFLSIGYSSCHWCHVMQRESFQNEKIAKILNDHFVSIKVDREERPDIDKHFQNVYQLMNGRPGGWPTSLFLTDSLKPFYAATYVPPEPQYGMMAFEQLLETIYTKYQNDKKLLSEKADEILRFINPKEKKIQATKLDLSIVKRFEEQAQQLFDNSDGGFNAAPKFPQASILDLLLDTYRMTSNKEALDMVLKTLGTMTKGGFYDRVDGGFCRYSTDNAWLIPHFEKMTYDNALLSDLYLKAYCITKNDFYRTIAFETIDFMLEKMSQDHLFYSASDADTEGEEGKYFVYDHDKALKSFTKAGIPKEAHSQLAVDLGMSKEGNFKGKNIIRIDDSMQQTIPYYQEAITALKKRRAKRTYPFIDKKVQVSWNAMMIKSLFRAGRIDSDYLKIATESLNALTETMYLDGELYHSALIGKKPKVKAFLEDYAYLSDLLIEAYRSTADEIYLIMAVKLANSAIEKYYEQGKWKFSRGEFETDADIYDTSYPSSIATMLSALLSISSLVDPVYKKFVFKTLELFSYDVMRQPISTPNMSKMIMRYLKDDIIIKTSVSHFENHITDLDDIGYPFVSLKADINDGYMLCNSQNCFGHEANWDGVIKVIEGRY